MPITLFLTSWPLRIIKLFKSAQAESKPDQALPDCAADGRADIGLSKEDARQLYERHGALVDKKFLQGLSVEEEQELEQIRQWLDEYEAPFYEPVERNLAELYQQRLNQANPAQPEK